MFLGRKKNCIILFESIILQLSEIIKKSSKTPVVTKINKRTKDIRTKFKVNLKKIEKLVLKIRNESSCSLQKQASVLPHAASTIITF